MFKLFMSAEIPNIHYSHFVSHLLVMLSIADEAFCLNSFILKLVGTILSQPGSSQRCPGFDSQQLPAFSLSSIFAS